MDALTFLWEMKNHFKSQEQSFCKLLKDFSYDPMKAVNNQIGPILMSINPKSDMITLTAGQCKKSLIRRYGDNLWIT